MIQIDGFNPSAGMCCEACVFDRGKHLPDCRRNPDTQTGFALADSAPRSPERLKQLLLGAPLRRYCTCAIDDARDYPESQDCPVCGKELRS